MKKPIEKPVVRLVGENGNAFNIMGLASRALRKAGADKEYINKYLAEAKKGDYNNLLIVTMKYVEVE